MDGIVLVLFLLAAFLGGFASGLAGSLSFAGVVTVELAKLYVLGLPALLAGLWIGFKLYGKLDDVAFRKLVLVLLLVSGMSLIVAHGWPLLRRHLL